MVCSNRFDVPSLRLIYSVVDVVCANVVRVSDAYTINDWGGGGVGECIYVKPSSRNTRATCTRVTRRIMCVNGGRGGDKRWCVLEKRHGHRRRGRITFYEGLSSRICCGQ